VDPNPKLMDDTFMFYFLQTVKSQDLIQDQSYPSLNLPAISGINVLVPPLEEQKRIVALLDAANERVTELTACYEQARTHANNLFTSALSDELEGSPDWLVKTLGNISEIAYGYTESAKHEVVGPKFLRITDITDRGVNWDDVPYCLIDEVQLTRHRLEDGDIVFARTGATTGKSFLVTSPPVSVCASYLIRLRIDRKLILPDFLNLNFQTNRYWKQVNEGISGAAQGGFNATKLGSLEVPVPPLGEQKRIVARLDQMRAKTVEMVATYDAKLQAAKNLRQSILETAFSGEL
jgi:type I restriction enzyme S subunit